MRGKGSEENKYRIDAVQYLNIFGRVYPPFFFFSCFVHDKFKGEKLAADSATAVYC